MLNTPAEEPRNAKPQKTFFFHFLKNEIITIINNSTDFTQQKLINKMMNKGNKPATMSSNYRNEQMGEYAAGDDAQFVGDGNQYYEEYVEAESEVHRQYYQQTMKPRVSGISFSNARNAGGPSLRGRVGHNMPMHHQQRFPPGAMHSYTSPFAPGGFNYGIGGGLRQPMYAVQGVPRLSRAPTQMHYSPMSLHNANRREIFVNAGHPIIGSVSLPNFLSKAPKPSKSRKASNKRKPCNCTKSMCLKLYCDCFANGEFCLDCNCKDCHNNLEHEAERSRAIKTSLERNPSAFKPKIGVAAKALGKTIDMERLHQRGCHCKRSNCLKNYCECYEAKVPCTDRCKCQSCRNTEHDRHNKFKDKFSTTAGGLAQLAAAAAAESRARSGSPCSEDDASDLCVVEGELKHQTNPKTQPWFYMTEDVIEATTMCLVAQAQEFEQTLPEEELEKSVLKEFGRCLEQIIDSAASCLPQNQQQQPQPMGAMTVGNITTKSNQ